MIQLILAALMLSIIHALNPNLWISLAFLSKFEKWSKFEATRITVIAGISYTLSTSIIGIFIGLLGYKLNIIINIIASIYAPIVLIVLGLIYICFGSRNNNTNIKKRLRHRKQKFQKVNKNVHRKKKPNLALILLFSSAMFFSPCIEIEAYYYNAGIYGLKGIILLSFIYIIVTIIGMVILVDLGAKGIRKLNEKFLFLERHEQVITGLILILLGLESFFIKL